MKRAACCLGIALVVILAGGKTVQSDDEVILQGFYWDCSPYGVTGDSALTGGWWNHLRDKTPDLAEAGFTAIWTPAPSKGHAGPADMGYGVFDLFDLGDYDQKGRPKTRFGNKAELIEMVDSLHAHNMDVYSDIVLNHHFGGYWENNPVIGPYLEVYHDDGHVNYPTTLRWYVLENVQQGDYYLKVTGYYLDWGGDNDLERAYKIRFFWEGEAPYNIGAETDIRWENDTGNDPPGYDSVYASSSVYWAHTDYLYDTDQYKITIPAEHAGNDIWVVLTPTIYVVGQGTMIDADPERDFRIWESWGPSGQVYFDIHTPTDFHYVTHTGAGEENYEWHYNHFHPATTGDYLEGWNGEGVSPRKMAFGSDFCHSDIAGFAGDDTVRQRQIRWGAWLTNTVGYDGYRLDFVKGVEPQFFAEWLNSMPLKNGAERFSVGEYWTSDTDIIKAWIDTLIDNGVSTIRAFDFPLQNSLSALCSQSPGFDMDWLRGQYIFRSDPYDMHTVTFVENHDTDKDYPIVSDKMLAYAFILFHEGIPCVFYRDYSDDPDCYNLKDEIDPLIETRQKYIGGDEISLQGDSDIYISIREGYQHLPGGVFIMNRTDSDRWWNDVDVSGWLSSSENVEIGDTLFDATDNSSELCVIEGTNSVDLFVPRRTTAGRVTGYSIYIPKKFSDYYTLHLGIDDGGQDVFPHETIEQSYYTGAASALMTLEFVDTAYAQDQDYIYSMYHDDPGDEQEMTAQELTNTMNGEAPGPYHYTERADDDQDICIKRFIHWIDYQVSGVDEPYAPSMVPIEGDYNWVVVRGFATDIDPCFQDDIWNIPDFTLYWLWLNDPREPEIGRNLYTSAEAFQGMFSLVDGKYRSVNEPPEGFDPEKMDDPYEHVKLSYAESKPNGELAQLISSDMDLSEFDWKGMIPEPLMKMPEFHKIFSDSRFSGTLEVVHLGTKEKSTLCLFSPAAKSELVSVVLVIDTDTGAFTGASWTKVVQQYLPLSEKDALEIAKKAVDGKYGEPKVTSLVWSRAFKTSRFMPSYKVIFPQETCTSYNAKAMAVYVHQNGSYDIYTPESEKSANIKGNATIPDRFALHQNYPNPFNPSTTVSYDLPEEANVVLKVYDILGQEVETLVNQKQAAGKYKVTFDGRQLSSGLYFFHLNADGVTATNKTILIK